MLLSMALELPHEAVTVPAARELVSTLLARVGLLEEEIENALLILSEICGNVVRHSQACPRSHYRVAITCHPDHLLIEVTDRGRGFDRDAVPSPTGDQVGGWGLWLIENLSEHVEFRSSAGSGSSVCVRIKAHYREPWSSAAVEPFRPYVE